ncbi:hypothetical protein QVD17_24068 [Tagetes erecta]|uniref:Uncharacterized protein n=1 Tax=Tagetes erecta TaxID=13708 RepID=A0AAD8KF87_TARER|nr:hypothetical protein QVD17_24068 [Tagetes erecta]
MFEINIHVYLTSNTKNVFDSLGPFFNFYILFSDTMEVFTAPWIGLGATPGSTKECRKRGGIWSNLDICVAHRP